MGEPTDTSVGHVLLVEDDVEFSEPDAGADGFHSIACDLRVSTPSLALPPMLPSLHRQLAQPVDPTIDDEIKTPLQQRSVFTPDQSQEQFCNEAQWYG